MDIGCSADQGDDTVDNITAPLAATLGDLLTLFVLALIGTVLVLVMDTPIPLIAVILMCIAAGWFIRRVLKNEWIKKVARGGWAPLIAAMLISSGAGMILDVCVGRYRGFALLSISMGGEPISILLEGESLTNLPIQV